MMRTLSEWKLTPYQLLVEMERDFNHLTDPSMQALFFLLFFRSPVEKDKVCLGAGGIISKDEALLNNCQRFIQRGLAHFSRIDQGGSGARFFFEFAYYLGKYLPEL